MRIALCDDFINERNEIYSVILDFFQKRNCIYSIDQFSSGEELLNDYTPYSYDIIFLDIYMKNLTGINTAKQIREVDRSTAIVFITSSTDHALEAFDIETLDYLIKPINAEKIEKIFNRYEKFYNYMDEQIEIKENGFSKKILLNSIQYVEVSGNYCYIHTTNGIIKQRSTLNTIYDLFNDISYFSRPHTSYVINLNYVNNFDNRQLILENGLEITTSRKFHNKFKEDFSNFIFTKLRNK